MNELTHQDYETDRAIPNFARDLHAEVEAKMARRAVAENIGRISLFDRLEWFRNLRLSGKLQTIFGAFFAICLAIALVLGFGLSQNFSGASSIIQLNDAMLEAIDARIAVGDVRYSTARYVADQDREALALRQQALDETKRHLSEIEANDQDLVQQFLPAVSKLSADLDTYDLTFRRLANELQSNGQQSRIEALKTELADQGTGLVTSSLNLTQNFADLRKSEIEGATANFFSMIVLCLILGVLAAIALFLGLRYLAHDYSRKISAITEGMDRLASGDRRFDVSGHEREDEIGQMARALEHFKHANRKLEDWARERSEQADQEVERQLERQRERDEQERQKTQLLTELAAQFEQTVGDVVQGVAAASTELQTTASQMATTAEQSSLRTDQVSADMKEANSGATAAAAASDEFATSIGEISRQASSSSDLARLANDATSEADSTISELSASAEQVGEIVELIQTIAQRTNLLALNASIEAARGGEAGRGFAVVASEVKELAMQTSRATGQVAEQIRAMQETTGASVGALRSIADQVRELESTSISIATAVDQQSVAGQDLARSIDLAARGTERVSGHLDDVRGLSLSTGAAANQVLNSANELELQAATLNEQVASFLARVRTA